MKLKGWFRGANPSAFNESIFRANVDRLNKKPNKKTLMKKWRDQLYKTEPFPTSSLNLSREFALTLCLPPLEWHNFEHPPYCSKIINTGHTTVVKGNWYERKKRPFLTGGPLLDQKYIFYHSHFHWGESEHALQGKLFPMEVHSVFFNDKYQTYESALKECDGILIVAKFCRLIADVPDEKPQTFRIRDLMHGNHHVILHFTEERRGKYTEQQSNSAKTPKPFSEDVKSSNVSSSLTLTKNTETFQNVESANKFIEEVAKNIRYVCTKNTSKLIYVKKISQLLPEFKSDYFFYLSGIRRQETTHRVTWIVDSQNHLLISKSQLKSFQIFRHVRKSSRRTRLDSCSPGTMFYIVNHTDGVDGIQSRCNSALLRQMKSSSSKILPEKKNYFNNEPKTSKCVMIKGIEIEKSKTILNTDALESIQIEEVTQEKDNSVQVEDNTLVSNAGNYDRSCSDVTSERTKSNVYETLKLTDNCEKSIVEETKFKDQDDAKDENEQEFLVAKSDNKEETIVTSTKEEGFDGTVLTGNVRSNVKENTSGKENLKKFPKKNSNIPVKHKYPKQDYLMVGNRSLTIDDEKKKCEHSTKEIMDPIKDKINIVMNPIPKIKFATLEKSLSKNEEPSSTKVENVSILKEPLYTHVRSTIESKEHYPIVLQKSSHRTEHLLVLDNYSNSNEHLLNAVENVQTVLLDSLNSMDKISYREDYSDQIVKKETNSKELRLTKLRNNTVKKESHVSADVNFTNIPQNYSTTGKNISNENIKHKMSKVEKAQDFECQVKIKEEVQRVFDYDSPALVKAESKAEVDNGPKEKEEMQEEVTCYPSIDVEGERKKLLKKYSSRWINKDIVQAVLKNQEMKKTIVSKCDNKTLRGNRFLDSQSLYKNHENKDLAAIDEYKIKNKQLLTKLPPISMSSKLESTLFSDFYHDYFLEICRSFFNDILKSINFTIEIPYCSRSESLLDGTSFESLTGLIDKSNKDTDIINFVDKEQKISPSIQPNYEVSVNRKLKNILNLTPPERLNLTVGTKAQKGKVRRKKRFEMSPTNPGKSWLELKKKYKMEKLQRAGNSNILSISINNSKIDVSKIILNVVEEQGGVDKCSDEAHVVIKKESTIQESRGRHYIDSSIFKTIYIPSFTVKLDDKIRSATNTAIVKTKRSLEDAAGLDSKLTSESRIPRSKALPFEKARLSDDVFVVEQKPLTLKPITQTKMRAPCSAPAHTSRPPSVKKSVALMQRPFTAFVSKREGQDMYNAAQKSSQNPPTSTKKAFQPKYRKLPLRRKVTEELPKAGDNAGPAPVTDANTNTRSALQSAAVKQRRVQAFAKKYKLKSKPKNEQ